MIIPSLAHAKVASCQGKGKMSNGMLHVMMLSSNGMKMGNREMHHGGGISLKLYVENHHPQPPNDCPGIQ